MFSLAKEMIVELRKADGDNATYALNRKLVDTVSSSYAQFEADMKETFNGIMKLSSLIISVFMIMLITSPHSPQKTKTAILRLWSFKAHH